MPAPVFRFRLQKVLDLREWEEKQAETALAAKTSQCVTAENQLRELHERRHAGFRISTGSGTVDLNAWAFRDAFRLRLTREIEEGEKILAQLSLEREDLLKIYRAKRTRRETLSKLADKQKQLFRTSQQRRESLILDDLNTAAYIRKMNAVEAPLG